MTGNQTLDAVVENLETRHKRFHLMLHPKATSTAEEKRELLDDPASPKRREYLQFGHVEIVKGQVLSYTQSHPVRRREFDTRGVVFKDVKEEVLLIYDGRNRIDFDKVKFELGLPKSVDLSFYTGDVEQLTGLQAGAISPFVTRPENLRGIYFDRRLIDEALQNPPLLWDGAVSTTQSLFANAADVYFALKQIPSLRDKTQIVRLT